MKYFYLSLLLILMVPGQAFAQEPAQTTTAHREQVFTRGGSDACLRCHSGDKPGRVVRGPGWKPET